MDKTLNTELRRVFLLHDLPEPLVRSARHLQIFDNYIKNTKLRIRSIRSPETNEWNFYLQQRVSLTDDFSQWKIAEIHLSESEHKVFEQFEGREVKTNERVETNEIRKNRYFYDLAGTKLEIDLFLGNLWGLVLAKSNFETQTELENFDIPSFAIAEVTENPFFQGENLVGKNFSDVQNEFAKMSKTEA